MSLQNLNSIEVIVENVASVLRYFRWRNLLPTHNTKTITTIIAIIIGRIQLHIYGSLRVDILHNYFRSVFVRVD